MIRTISLDASTSCTGWSVWDDDDLIECGKIKFKDKNWRVRIQEQFNLLPELIKKYKPTEIIAEDVPLGGQGGKTTIVKLGVVQGVILSVCTLYNIKVTFKSVPIWRADIGLYDGTEKGKKRENLKPKSINLANELFGLDLKCEYTKKGIYSEAKSDDDISDSILIYASTRDKYKVKTKPKKKPKTKDNRKFKI